MPSSGADIKRFGASTQCEKISWFTEWSWHARRRGGDVPQTETTVCGVHQTAPRGQTWGPLGEQEIQNCVLARVVPRCSPFVPTASNEPEACAPMENSSRSIGNLECRFCAFHGHVDGQRNGGRTRRQRDVCTIFPNAQSGFSWWNHNVQRPCSAA